MALGLDVDVTISRRSMLGVVGSVFGAAVTAAPSLSAASQLPPVRAGSKFVRPLGETELRCSAPGMVWNDFDHGSITVSLTTTGRPVRLRATLPLVYGGPENSGAGISFAEDGRDLHHNSERGFATAQIEKGTIVAAILTAETVRQVSAGFHTWTLRVRHENPLSGPEAQHTYCQTRRVAPLEFTAVEL